MFERLFKFPLELYRDGLVTFSGPLQLELRILAAIVLGAIVIWLYRRMPAQVKPWRRRLVTAIRIAAVVLLFYGTGPIKGFALTLTVGICVNIFAAVFVTRTAYDILTERFRIKRLSI